MKLFFAFVFTLTTLFTVAQDTTINTNTNLIPKPIFFGGGIVLGGGAGNFQLGLNPEILQSYNEYVDLGAAMNLYYSTYKSTSLVTLENYKSTNTQFGLGAFARLWPLKQFFIQVQPEYNWTFSSANNYTKGTSGSSNVSAPSLLTGIGYGNRSEHGFSYFSVMFDLINAQQSPYRMGQTSPQPIFRAGFGFPIHFSRK
jgi:hypothetical protein